MFKIVRLIILAFLLWILNVSFNKQQGNTTRHTVQINHPGISLTESTERTLFEIKNEQGHSKEFYMNVETVVCGDSHCRIDTIQIYWDALGFFDRLVLPMGVELEKAEGEHFKQSDYNKLNTILANKNCSLKDVYKEEVVGTETTEGIDAYSGATIILNTNDYVEGAVWTCYTLWHWANGDIFSIIRNITSEHLSIDDLVVLLKKENTAEKIFGLEQMINHKYYQPQVINLILESAPNSNYKFSKLTIEYFKSSPSLYFDSMKNLIKSGNQKQRLLYLNSVLETKKNAPTDFYESISQLLPKWNDYPSVNSFLTILENKNISIPSINQSIITLLDKENFVIARRAFWFLQNQNLNPKQQEKIRSFQNKNNERL